MDWKRVASNERTSHKMKKTGIIIIALLFAAITAIAQPTNGTPPLPPDLMNTPVTKWVITGGALLAILGVIGRIFAAAAAGGGIVGIFRGVVFGQNPPPKQ